MADYWLIYRDIDDYEPRQSFEMMGVPPPHSMVIEDNVIPGLPGMKPVYIKWHHRRIGVDEVHLLTYTHTELKQPEIRDLVNQALKVAQRRN
jgi:hypothetical protein